MEDSLRLSFSENIASNTANYRALQRLGAGGSAETYLMLATSGSLRGQVFAVKLFRRLSKPEWQKAFLDETKFLQGCNHPSVMRVFDDGVHLDRHPFVVAEYLPSTLERAMRTRLIMMAKLAYAIQLLSALEYLAQPEVAVVHRDIKPANIFIKGGSCVLGDFGLIKRAASELPNDREMVKASLGPGMPRNYRTPDLIQYLKGGPVPTEKSDIYQLGLVFAEMFSGNNPQRPMKGASYSQRIELEDFWIEGGLGPPIKKLIRPMLDETPKGRPKASEAMIEWQELFLRAAKQSNALEGFVL